MNFILERKLKKLRASINNVSASGVVIVPADALVEILTEVADTIEMLNNDMRSATDPRLYSNDGH